MLEYCESRADSDAVDAALDVMAACLLLLSERFSDRLDEAIDSIGKPLPVLRKRRTCCSDASAVRVATPAV